MYVHPHSHSLTRSLVRRADASLNFRDPGDVMFSDEEESQAGSDEEEVIVTGLMKFEVPSKVGRVLSHMPLQVCILV